MRKEITRNKLFEKSLTKNTDNGEKIKEIIAKNDSDIIVKNDKTSDNEDIIVKNDKSLLQGNNDIVIENAKPTKTQKELATLINTDNHKKYMLKNPEANLRNLQISRLKKVILEIGLKHGGNEASNYAKELYNNHNIRNSKDLYRFMANENFLQKSSIKNEKEIVVEKPKDAEQ